MIKNKYKFLIVLVIFLMSFSIVSGMEYPVGEKVTLYSIDQCQGPVNIKMNSENQFQSKNVKIENCDKINKTDNEIYWECWCDDNFDINAYVDENSKDTYHFKIGYYLQYSKTDNETIIDNNRSLPSPGYIENRNYFRTKLLNDNEFKSMDNDLFEPNITLINVIIGSILLVFLIIGALLYKIKGNFGGGNTNYDPFSNQNMNNKNDITNLFNKK